MTESEAKAWLAATDESEAKAWLAATERSRTEWRLDEIHNTVDDAIIFKGGTKAGYFVQIRRLHRMEGRKRIPLNRWGVEIGNYEGAIPHIGEAEFTVLGRKGFDYPDDILTWLTARNVLPAAVISALDSNTVEYRKRIPLQLPQRALPAPNSAGEPDFDMLYEREMDRRQFERDG